GFPSHQRFGYCAVRGSFGFSIYCSFFWEFVKAGGYQNQQKSTGGKQVYRFDKPATDGYPFMLELFSRAPDQLGIQEDAHLIPIPAEEEISSLSAILLDDDYYQC